MVCLFVLASASAIRPTTAAPTLLRSGSTAAMQMPLKRIDRIQMAAAVAAPQPADESRTPSRPLMAFVAATSVSILTAVARQLPSTITTAALGGSAVLPTRALLGLRLAFLSVVVASLGSSLTDRKPHMFNMMLYKDSKLAEKSVPFKGLERLTTFTMQCWALQGLYFACATATSVAHLGGLTLPTALLRLTHGLFDVCAATAFLVTTVVTFVLIPSRIKRKDSAGLARMLSWRPLCMHNLNVLFMTTEMLLNSVPIVGMHGLYPAIFGIEYVLISWWWLQRTGITYYPFLDPTLPPAKGIAIHAALFVVLVAFFAIRVAAAQTAAFAPLVVRIPALYGAALAITWWPHGIRGWPAGLAKAEKAGSE
eukprot:CAMPEP_0115870898 /NCGR_PEP_ID=MMETSP0287-20121206/22577_1 /TAXON_ID=412157 /ORGANISM="Chrysochromulina rotalis, Strain UIO044" /LENGTH=366 /DNA_ID=CAMNT_0003325661 /DNA_START=37 /DNA_END=1137 /DNA_ORIENTATION=+